MKRPSFFQGVIVAAVLGFFASALVATLTPFVGFGAVLRMGCARSGARLPSVSVQPQQRARRPSRHVVAVVDDCRCHLVVRATAVAVPFDPRRRGLARTVTVLLLGLVSGADGSGAQHPEHFRRCVGDDPFGEPVPHGLVLFPRAGAVCGDSTDGEASPGEGTRPTSRLEIRSCKAPGRRGTAPSYSRNKGAES